VSEREREARATRERERGIERRSRPLCFFFVLPEKGWSRLEAKPGETRGGRGQAKGRKAWLWFGSRAAEGRASYLLSATEGELSLIHI
jgi:hypothetical protein